MRISTNTIFEQGLGNVLRAQGQMIRSQEQLASGKRVTSPADDPVAASRALELSQSKSMTDQFGRNGELAWIASGLREGDRVILYPGDAVADGIRVQPRTVPMAR